MTEFVDKSKIKAGDQVKVSYLRDGFRWSSELVTVVDGNAWGLMAAGYYLNGVEVIEHTPNFDGLEDALAKARIDHEETRKALENAEKALEQAKNPSLKYAYGTRVNYLRGNPYNDHRNKSAIVVETPLECRDIDNDSKVWIKFDDESYWGKYPSYTTEDNLTRRSV